MRLVTSILPIAICSWLITLAPIARADSLVDKLAAPRAGGASINVGGVTVVFDPPSLSGVPGQVLELSAEFIVPPGWHIYGKPLPEGYTPTAIRMQGAEIAEQSFSFPRPAMVTFADLGETMPVYQNTVRANGKLRLRGDLKPGTYDLVARVELQECDNKICKMPQTASATIPLVIKSTH